MNNLHRDLAPISEAAWAEIEEEATRTLKRHLAARRVVDVEGPKGTAFAAVNTGHVRPIEAPGAGIRSVLREARPLVELRVPFTLSRQAIDDVARGSEDSDWDPVKAAARTLAFAEDRAVFEGYAAAGIEGIRAACSNPAIPLPPRVEDYPEAVARAVSQLRLAGCNGPYALVLGASAYTAASGGTDEGDPVFHHLNRIVDGVVVWAPAIEGAVVLSTRGGDYELHLGQDLSIGYLSHDAESVQLYFQESFTFLANTAEAAVALTAS